MPILARWYLKTLLVYFIAALFVGLLLTFGASGNFAFLPPDLTSVYFPLLMFGWITQWIIGVAYWMFPVFSRSQPHGSEAIAWFTYVLINLGLILRAIGEPLNAAQPGTAWGWVLVFSAFLQWLAGLGFVVNTWPRVKEK